MSGGSGNTHLVMHDGRYALDALWIAFVLYWAAAARGAKRVARSDTTAANALSVILVAAGAVLLFGQNIQLGSLDHTSAGGQGERHAIGLALTAAGIGFAFWARHVLGGNWSGRVVVKEGHTLTRSGPYRHIRHPIYTGLLIALGGTAIYFGEWRSWIAFALFVAGLWLKASREEAMMAGEFGGDYAEYRREAGMFVPRYERGT
jgi:protein-S-isoprenylcysteine O-methyltransferase Ste14